MTVRELVEKLSLYRDDVEVYIGHYDDIMGIETYCPPTLRQEEVDAYYSKTGHLCHTRFAYCRTTKKDTILVLG